MTFEQERAADVAQPAASSQLVYLATLSSGVAAWALIMALAWSLFDRGAFAAQVMFDYREGAVPPFPFSISCIEWLVFCIGAAELFHHWRRTRFEASQLRAGLLPEGREVMLDRAVLAEVSERIHNLPEQRNSRLRRLIQRVIWQFQGNQSLSQATSIMDATLELDQHDLDLQYNMIRYLVWVLPTIGFIGTVWGLSRGLGAISQGLDPKSPDFQVKLNHITQELSVAFNTTLMALILSGILVLLMQLIQREEEESLNRAGQYCLDHLINKLFIR